MPDRPLLLSWGRRSTPGNVCSAAVLVWAAEFNCFVYLMQYTIALYICCSIQLLCIFTAEYNRFVLMMQYTIALYICCRIQLLCIFAAVDNSFVYLLQITIVAAHNCDVNKNSHDMNRSDIVAKNTTVNRSSSHHSPKQLLQHSVNPPLINPSLLTLLLHPPPPVTKLTKTIT